jgi:hypothetical protein
MFLVLEHMVGTLGNINSNKRPSLVGALFGTINSYLHFRFHVCIICKVLSNWVLLHHSLW